MKHKIEYPDANGSVVRMGPGGVIRRIAETEPGITWFRLTHLLLTAADLDVDRRNLGIARTKIRIELDRGWLTESDDHGLYPVKQCPSRCPAVELLGRQCRLPDNHDSDHEVGTRRVTTITWKRDPE